MVVDQPGAAGGAAGLLVGHRGQLEVAPQRHPEAGQQPDDGHAHGHHVLHVDRTPAPDGAVVDLPANGGCRQRPASAGTTSTWPLSSSGAASPSPPGRRATRLARPGPATAPPARPRPRAGCRPGRPRTRPRCRAGWWCRSAAAPAAAPPPPRLPSPSRPGPAPGASRPPGCWPPARRMPGVTKYIYVMQRVRKAHQDKLILDDVTLAFLPGPRSAWSAPTAPASRRCSRSWPGWRPSPTARPPWPPGPPSASCSRSRSWTRTRMCSATSRRAWPAPALLARFEELSLALGEAGPDDMERLLDEYARVQDAIEAANAWDLDAQLEMAMDALRLPPGTPTSPPCRAGSGAGSPSAGCCCPGPTCSCSTSPPTTWTPRACSGWSSTWPPTRARCWPSPTTATSSTTSPAGSWSWTGAAPTRMRATTRRTWRPRRPGWPPRPGLRRPRGSWNGSWSGFGPAPRAATTRAGPGCGATRSWPRRPSATGRSTSTRSRSRPVPASATWSWRRPA